jgi:hypothetical protein
MASAAGGHGIGGRSIATAAAIRDQRAVVPSSEDTSNQRLQRVLLGVRMVHQGEEEEVQSTLLGQSWDESRSS